MKDVNHANPVEIRTGRKERCCYTNLPGFNAHSSCFMTNNLFLVGKAWRCQTEESPLRQQKRFGNGR